MEEFKRELKALLDKYGARITYAGYMYDTGIGEFEQPRIVITDRADNVLVEIESYSLESNDLTD